MNSRIETAILTCMVLSVGLVLPVVYKATTQDQTPDAAESTPKNRVMVKRSDFSPPIRIGTVKTRRGVIETGRPYLDDDEWVKGLTVSVANTSGKTITYIGVDVIFRRSEKQGQEPGALWSLNYGVDPFQYSTAEAVPDSPIKPVLPGDTVEISLSEDGFQSLVSFLKSANYFSGTNKAELRLGKIGFSDGTLWMTGRFFMRDSTSSWGWRRIDSPSAKRKSDQFELVLNRI